MSKYLTENKPKKIVCATREEWLAQRTGIGASEVGIILGVNRWTTPYQLWRRKKGIDAETPMNPSMIAGLMLEDAVSHFFELETGHKVIKASAGDIIYVHPEKDYLRVTPDRTYWVDENGVKNEENKGVLECKTSQMEIDKDSIPQQYYCQVQYQMGVMQKEHAALAWLTRGRDFGYTYIDFDPDFFAYMVEKVDEFWNRYIIGDEIPEAQTSDDVVTRYPTAASDKSIEVGEEMYSLYSELKEVRRQRLLLEKQEDGLVDKMKVACGDAEAMTYCGSTLATWKQGKDTSKFDKTLFAKEQPEMYAKYCTEVPGIRRFVLK